MGATRERQIRVRVSEQVDQWLDERAGGPRMKAAFIRELIERERAAHRAQELLQMFDRAAEDLTGEDDAERGRLLGAFARRT